MTEAERELLLGSAAVLVALIGNTTPIDRGATVERLVEQMAKVMAETKR